MKDDAGCVLLFGCVLCCVCVRVYASERARACERACMRWSSPSSGAMQFSYLDEVSVENEVAQISQLRKSCWQLRDVVARQVEAHQPVQVCDLPRNLVDLVPAEVELNADKRRQWMTRRCES